MSDARKDWEYEVTISKRLGKWEASDGKDDEVGKTPTEALEDLWLIVKDRVEKEHNEMWQETKWEEMENAR